MLGRNMPACSQGRLRFRKHPVIARLLALLVLTAPIVRIVRASVLPDVLVAQSNHFTST